MTIFIGIVGLLLILIILQDAFETIVLPRRVSRRFRLARMFYRSTWAVCSSTARWIHATNRREYYLSYYGPLSLLFLLVIWAVGLIVGFAMLQWAFGSALASPERHADFFTDLYVSGTTFITLGLGDVIPNSPIARVLLVVEAGGGFGFLALVIGYLPVIYQAFSRREVNISLLDARAGSPPSGLEMLRRHVRGGSDVTEGVQALHDWEHWAAELLESHLSYPVLMYYRSQHERQSWLAALATILDACTLIIAGIDDMPVQGAWYTFAIARHAAVDLSQILGVRPDASYTDRLPPADFARLREALVDAGMVLHEGESTEQKLRELRRMYEPYIQGLSKKLQMALPDWLPPAEVVDDWQTSSWEHVVTASRMAALQAKSRKMRQA
ncbi:MAG: two pore domain potassium channel family protein [Ktedonobacteraceae bacterium]|nr:two pore domain potassium channel family protein [Ktedonobacteraceae bacterium]